MQEDIGFDQPHDDEQRGADNEEIRRQGEDRPRLTDPTQIENRHQDHQRKIHQNHVGLESRKNRDHVMHASRDTDGHIEHVIDHQGGGGNQSRQDAQVLACHNIRSPPTWIGRDGLAIGDRHDGEQAQNHQANGQRQAQVQRASRHQVNQDRLGGKGDGRNRIRRENSKCLEFTQALPFGLHSRYRDTNKGPFEPIERTSQRLFWRASDLSSFKHPFLDAAKGLMPWQRYTYTYIAWCAAWSFFPLSKHDQIKIVFIADVWMLIGSISLWRALERVFVLLIHRFCSLVTSCYSL